MITPDQVELTWGMLEIEALEANELRVRELDGFETAAGKSLFALDAKRNRHLLLPIPARTRISEDTKSGGVHISSHYLLDQEQDRNFADVVCLKPHLNKLFSIILSEILNRLQENPERPDLTALQVLNRWRELLDREPSQLPEMDRLVGLFGELWHLREVIKINPSSLTCWTGPYKSRHDFGSSSLSLEVKATLMRRGRVFTINGHDQLEAVSGTELYLAVMQLEQSPTGSSIPELLDSIVALGADRYSLLVSLANLGITPDVLDLSSDLKFRVIDSRVYAVTDDFPRITADSFRGGVLPNGIRAIKYEIDLSTEPPFAVDARTVSLIYERLALG